MTHLKEAEKRRVRKKRGEEEGKKGRRGENHDGKREGGGGN